MPENKILALVNLLDDPDEFIITNVKNELLSYGDKVIPMLEKHWEEHSLDAFARQRIEDIIQQIQFNEIKKALENWKNHPHPNLLDGVLLINKFQYPDVDTALLKKKISQLERDVWLEISPVLTSYEKVNVVNRILFEVYGFSGNKQNYHAPSNSFLSDVLETKKGNPLSLSILYLLIMQPLGLPVYGVNLPSHFVLCYLDENHINEETSLSKDNILMYINPFSRGTIFNRKEIERFLAQLKIFPKESYFAPCSNLDIIKRLINNLIFSFERLGNETKVNALEELRAIF